MAVMVRAHAGLWFFVGRVCACSACGRTLRPWLRVPRRVHLGHCVALSRGPIQRRWRRAVQPLHRRAVQPGHCALLHQLPGWHLRHGAEPLWAVLWPVRRWPVGCRRAVHQHVQRQLRPGVRLPSRVRQRHRLHLPAGNLQHRRRRVVHVLSRGHLRKRHGPDQRGVQRQLPRRAVRQHRGRHVVGVHGPVQRGVRVRRGLHVAYCVRVPAGHVQVCPLWRRCRGCAVAGASCGRTGVVEGGAFRGFPCPHRVLTARSALRVCGCVLRCCACQRRWGGNLRVVPRGQVWVNHRPNLAGVLWCVCVSSWAVLGPVARGRLVCVRMVRSQAPCTPWYRLAPPPQATARLGTCAPPAPSPPLRRRQVSQRRAVCAMRACTAFAPWS